MPIEDRTITEALEELAAFAGSPPPELPRVITLRVRRADRFRRRRLLVAVAVLAVVGTVTAATAAIVATTHRPTPGVFPGPSAGATAASATPGAGGTPPTPTAGLGSTTTTGSALPWHVPSWNQPGLPQVPVVWPGSHVTLPVAPDGRHPTLIANMDGSHVLVQTGPNDANPPTLTFWAYDTDHHGFRRIVDFPRTDVQPGAWAVSSHWLLVMVGDWDGQRVYKVPLTGGAPRLVGTIHGVSLTGPWYATDTALYYTGPSGVMSLNLAGGTPTAVAGSGGLRLVHDSPWAALVDNPYGDRDPLLGTAGVDHQLRNVLTGTVVKVSPPLNVSTLTCVPTFCLGTTIVHGLFIQRPDGSDRRTLDSRPNPLPRSLVPVANGGLVVADVGAGKQVFDPVSGKAALFEANVPLEGGSYHAAFTDEAIGWTEPNGSYVDDYFIFARTQ